MMPASEMGNDPPRSPNFSRETPFITIGIPTYNSAWCLRDFLRALEVLDYPKNKTRIIFVDNKSTDRTPQILGEFVGKHEGRYEKILIVSARSNIPTARNLCVGNSIGEYILFLDSDVIPPRDTIGRMLDIFAIHPALGIVGFPYAPKSTAKAMPKSSSREPSPVLFIQGGCTMIRLRLFTKVGKFNSLRRSYEDLEFSSRAFRAGYLTMLDRTRTPIHLSAASSRAKPRGVLNVLEFVFASFGQEVLTAKGGLGMKEEKYPISPRAASSVGSVAIAVGTAYWKVVSTLMLILFYLSSFTVQSSKGGWSSLAEAIWFSWLGLPLLATMATFRGSSLRWQKAPLKS